MKTLFISNDPTVFTQTSSTHARICAYAEAIGELHVISRGDKTEDKQIGALFLHSVKPLPTVLGRLLFLRGLSSRAHKIITACDIEVVSAQDPFEYGRIALKSIQGTNAKLHIQVHTDFLSPYFATESHKNAIRMHIADTVLLKADGIRVVSERIKQSLIKRYGRNIVEPTIVPIATQLPDTPPVPAPPLPQYPFTFALIAVGRLEKEKRLEDIIKVVATLIKNRYPVGLLIVGDGRERQPLTKLARQLGVEHSVVFLGERSDVPALLHTVNAFIQTSAYEGYGRTYIEAAYAGVPMVVTDAGIIGDVFTHNESALVCPVGDVECLVRQVARLIESSTLRRSISKNARATAEMHLAGFSNLSALIAEDLAQAITRIQ